VMSAKNLGCIVSVRVSWIRIEQTFGHTSVWILRHKSAVSSIPDEKDRRQLPSKSIVEDRPHRQRLRTPPGIRIRCPRGCESDVGGRIGDKKLVLKGRRDVPAESRDRADAGTNEISLNGWVEAQAPGSRWQNGIPSIVDVPEHSSHPGPHVLINA